MTPLQSALLRWAAATRRDLPWRRTRDPWLVLVSELMLQQTQVARVVPRYEAFVLRFPTPASCAAASVGEVVELWAGLGYNRRAVHLHRAAQAIVAEHGGTVPGELEALLALPGIGPYTARAVLAFAYEQDVAVLDTNAGRFISRAIAGRPLVQREAQDRLDELVPEGRSWEWNQGVLDLGATICTKRGPDCSRCPVAAWCVWRCEGDAGRDPADGSAATTRRQSRFEGSDRQGRGRLVAALRRGPVPTSDVAVVAGWPDEPARAHEAAMSLVDDGLACERDGVLTLP